MASGRITRTKSFSGLFDPPTPPPPLLSFPPPPPPPPQPHDANAAAAPVKKEEKEKKRKTKEDRKDLDKSPNHSPKLNQSQTQTQSQNVPLPKRQPPPRITARRHSSSHFISRDHNGYDDGDSEASSRRSSQASSMSGSVSFSHLSELEGSSESPTAPRPRARRSFTSFALSHSDLQASSPSPLSTSFSTFRSLFFKKRLLFVVVIAWLGFALFPPLNEPSQPFLYNPPEEQLSPEDLANLTLSQNSYFKDQILFSPEVKAIFMTYLKGMHLAPGKFAVRKGDPPAFIIVENGTLSAEEETSLTENFHHGDSIGGLNIFYQLPHLKSWYVSDQVDGAFIWKTDDPEFIAKLSPEELLGQGIERKALQTLMKKSPKKPVVLFPGFASTQLIAWKEKHCFGATIQVGDRVWLNLEKVLHDNIFQEQCWLRCMMLDVTKQTDPADCKLRPEEGLNSIYDLAPGLLGPVTTIFKTLVTSLAMNFGYDVSSLLAIPYDWRLAPKLLEERDLFFTKTRLQIEYIVEHNQRKPTIVVCHSLGCNLFHYFLNWMEATYPSTWRQWIDEHITMHYSVSAPLLGAVESTKGMLSGMTFGLPISEKMARIMGSTWSSGLYLLPRDPSIARNGSDDNVGPRPRWFETPVVVKLESGEVLNFTINDVTSGKMFQTLAEKIPEDPYFEKFLASLKENYLKDPLLPMAGGAKRPPIKSIVVVYGINIETEVGYVYTYKNTTGLVLQETITEGAKGATWKRRPTFVSDEYVGTNKAGKSGDGTVPYTSLSWANTWHFPNMAKSRIPSTQRLNVDKLLSALPTGGPWNLVQQINTIQPAYNKFESSSPEQDIVLMEVESVDHRNAIKNEFFMELFQEELYWIARKEFLTQPEYLGSHRYRSSSIVQDIWRKSLLQDPTPPAWFTVSPVEPNPFDTISVPVSHP